MSDISLTLYNTKSGKKEVFSPKNKAVSVYVCGPTVYGAAHIGNARPAVVFDMLRRVLAKKWQVRFVSNITDIDDKIIKVAQGEQKPAQEIARRYAQQYESDIARLGVLAPDAQPKATEHIDAICEMIKILIEKGNAYEAEGHVLFDVNSFSDYGALSHRSLDEMEAGARVEVAPYKRNPADFVLWKPASTDSVGWKSPWGLGRPGWHIECSAMIKAHLGEEIDIHAAGSDLIFPHHENERAQSICAFGGSFVRHWMHNAMVIMDKGKMSKSLGNVVSLGELFEKWDSRVIRLALLMTHYRQPLYWSEQNLQQAQNVLGRIYRMVDNVAGVDEGVQPNDEVYRALADDLNTPKAIGYLSKYAKEINQTDDTNALAQLNANLREGLKLLGLEGIERVTNLTLDSLRAYEALIIEKRAEPLGFTQHRQEWVDENVLERLAVAYATYKILRGEKDYAEADKIREEIINLGGKIEIDKEGKIHLYYGLTKINV